MDINKYTIKLEGSNNKITKVVGKPLYLNLEKSPIEDLTRFCDFVFSCDPPFSLWGVPREIDDGFLVHVVDLPTGSKMNFQIYREVISITLEPKSSGDSITRFITNIRKLGYLLENS